MHEHIQALLMFEINKKLEELQRRGVGYIDCEYKTDVAYTEICYAIMKSGAELTETEKAEFDKKIKFDD